LLTTLLATLVALLPAWAAADTRDEVLARGSLTCGVSELSPGRLVQLEDGGVAGFHAGFCQALAAALFGDSSAVVYIPLGSRDRFLALRSGEVDVLVGNTTVTLSRDVGSGLAFGPVVFIDGRERFAPMVREGDDAWLDTVSWVIYALMQADEWGITSAVAASVTAEQAPPALDRFLGFERSVAEQFDLEPAALRIAIVQVGNYGELYDRHLGPGRTVALPRGPNRSFLEGGQLFVPPFGED
jgi:general L-amino acid transport system substrate-binding protein